MKLRIPDRVALQVLDAADWHNQQRAGWGFLLVDAVAQAYKAIERHPLILPEIQDGVRRYRLSNFRYYIYYRVRESHLEAVAFVHTARHPDTWMGRQQQDDE